MCVIWDGSRQKSSCSLYTCDFMQPHLWLPDSIPATEDSQPSPLIRCGQTVPTAQAPWQPPRWQSLLPARTWPMSVKASLLARVPAASGFRMAFFDWFKFVWEESARLARTNLRAGWEPQGPQSWLAEHTYWWPLENPPRRPSGFIL